MNKRIREKRRKQWWRHLGMHKYQLERIYNKFYKIEFERWNSHEPVDQPFFHYQPERLNPEASKEDVIV